MHDQRRVAFTKISSSFYIIILRIENLCACYNSINKNSEIFTAKIFSHYINFEGVYS